MRVKCFDTDTSCPQTKSTIPIRLFGDTTSSRLGAIGRRLARRLYVERLVSTSSIRDLLRLSLAVVAADHAVHRKFAQDGWTREIELEVPLEEPSIWRELDLEVGRLLKFLTGDIWSLKFKKAKYSLVSGAREPRWLAGRTIALLSGGADSLVGAIDLAATGECFTTVSQTSSETAVQRRFSVAAGAHRHCAWTHGLHLPFIGDGSQRARSMGFFGFALIAATSTAAFRDGALVDVHASENGLISLNPALTPARIGSASTRTTHPCFIGQLQGLLSRLGVGVQLKNNYQTMTKGEMFARCADPDLLRKLLPESMSCGKSRRRNMHCGRCVPCIIRRAAFKKSCIKDTTAYVFGPNETTDGFGTYDDVRSAYLGSARNGDRNWIECMILPSLFECHVADRHLLVETAGRGLKEVHNFLIEALS